MTSIRGWLTAAAGAASLASVHAAQAQTPETIAPARPCASLVGLTLPGSTMRITKATAIPSEVRRAPGPAPVQSLTMPAYCRAEGEIDPRTGVDGKPYAIGFALALPDAWNGRFLYQGGGGLNGAINPPFGGAASGAAPALARGFAVLSTDSGHKGAVFNDDFMKDQEAALNFAHGSVGKSAPVAKAVIAAYYGRPARRSYFTGCSTGGREAMLSSERYPNEFDGIISGDPAMETGYSNLGLAWAHVTFNRYAPKGPDGKPQPDKLFSASDKKLLISRLLETCDGLDGAKDGLIFASGACKFDPAVLTCKGKKTDACLAPNQVAAIKVALAGPKTRGGVQVYPGFPYDTGLASPGPGIGGILQTLGASPVGKPDLSTTMDVDRAAEQVRLSGWQHLTDTASGTNLSTFFGHGGKILYYHGLSDPWFSPLDTLGYYQRLPADNGGADKVRASSRIFLVPGMGHCGGGPATLDQFDLLTALVDWVEDGKAPDLVIATGMSLPGVSRPLCAWPAHAQYSGSGEVKDARNFACRE
jgi:feruloyl esterase